MSVSTIPTIPGVPPVRHTAFRPNRSITKVYLQKPRTTPFSRLHETPRCPHHLFFFKRTSPEHSVFCMYLTKPLSPHLATLTPQAFINPSNHN